MIESKPDPQTPPDENLPGSGPAPKRPNHWHVLSVINTFIILAALGLIFFLWPNKPAWLRACPLLNLGRVPAAQVGDPAALSIAENGSEAGLLSNDQATITPAPTLSVATATPLKTITAAPTSQPPSAKATPSVSSGQYTPQEGSPFYISAKTFQGAEEGCNWIGIAGQAFDAKDAPQEGLVVVVDGKLGEKEINLTAVTGSALLYGPAGYEILLSQKPQESEGTLTIQLFHELGRPLSDKVPFATSANCEKNLAIVNFVEMK